MSRDKTPHPRSRIRRHLPAIESLENRQLLATLTGTGAGDADAARPLITSGKAAAHPNEVAPRVTAPTAENYLRFLDRRLTGETLTADHYAQLRKIISRGGSRDELVRQVLSTNPARVRLVADLTNLILDRQPTATETRAGLRDLGRSGDPWRLIARLTASDEFYRTKGQGQNASFVEALRTTFRANLNPTRTSQFVRALDNGLPRSVVTLALTRTPAFRRALVINLAPSYLSPDNVRTLGQGAFRAYSDVLARPGGYKTLVSRLATTADAYQAAQRSALPLAAPPDPFLSLGLGAGPSAKPGASPDVKTNFQAGVTAPRAGELTTDSAGLPDGQQGGFSNTVVLLPKTYAMNNGDNGSSAWLDTDYYGPNRPTQPQEYLSGSLGKLTDGVTGNTDWATDPGDWVGWLSRPPQITFDFASELPLAKYQTFSVFGNNRSQYSVKNYTGLTLEFSTDGVNWYGSALNTFTPKQTDATARWNTFTIDASGLPIDSARYVRASFAQDPNNWTFISEVRFGSPGSDFTPDASVLPVVSYSGPNGDSIPNMPPLANLPVNFIPLWDTTYQPSAGGSIGTLNNRSPLAGGLGKLTDGVTGDADWRHDDGAAWVAYTRFASSLSNPNPSLVFDLGTPSDIQAVRIFTNQYNGASLYKDVTVELSNDQVNWSNAQTFTPPTPADDYTNPVSETHNLKQTPQAAESTNYRYARLTFDLPGGVDSLLLSEIQFIGTPPTLAPVSYSATAPNLDPRLDDPSYTGQRSNNLLSGGLGKLTDGTFPDRADWTLDHGGGQAITYLGWNAQTTPQITYDFGKRSLINSVSAFFDTVPGGGIDTGVPYSVKVEFSDDGTTWGREATYVSSVGDKANIRYPWVTYRLDRPSAEGSYDGEIARYARITLTPQANKALLVGEVRFGGTSDLPRSFGPVSYQAPAGGQDGAFSLTGTPGVLTDGSLGPDTISTQADANQWVGYQGAAGPITFDLGRSVPLDSIRVYANNTGTIGANLYKDVTFEFSDDGSTWTDAATFTTTETQRGDRSASWLNYAMDRSVVGGEALSARYVRATFTGQSPGDWLLLGEVQFRRSIDDTSDHSVKRVPGYLNQAPYTAIPYLAESQPGRSIWESADGLSSDVDYWALTLNGGDTLQVEFRNTTNGVAPRVRIWNPLDQEVIAVPIADPDVAGGVVYRIPSGLGGQYTLGISAPKNATYARQPSAASASAPPGSNTLGYDVEFKTYPGTQSSISTVLTNYKDSTLSDPEAGKGNSDAFWPIWSDQMASAYTNFRDLALAGQSNQIKGLMKFSDFKSPGSNDDLDDSDTFLSLIWAPFLALSNEPAVRNYIPSTDPVVEAKQRAAIDAAIQGVYGSVNWVSSDTWKTMALDYVQHPNDYWTVHDQIALANSARKNLSGFVTALNQFNQTVANNLFNQAQSVASIIAFGTSSNSNSDAYPKLTQPADLTAVILDTLIDVVAAAGVAGLGLLGEANPAVAIIGSGVVTGVADVLKGLVDSNSDDENESDTSKRTSDDHDLAPPDQNLFEAAAFIDSTLSTNFTKQFDKLTKAVSDNYGNFGLLRVMNRAAFNISDGPDSDAAAQTNVLTTSYQRTLYQQLIPKVFSWRSTNGREDSIPNHQNLHPIDLTVSFSDQYNYFPDYENPFAINPFIIQPRNWGAGTNLPNARNEALQLQSGGSYLLPDYPVISDSQTGSTIQLGHVLNQVDGGNFVPIPAQGKSNRFYTLGYGTIDEALESIDQPGDNLAGTFPPTFTGHAYFVNEWGLFNSAGQEMSPGLAAILFGSTPNLKYYWPQQLTTANGSFFNWDVQPGGFTTRADVFFNWGKDTPGFSSRTLIPFSPGDVTSGTFEGNWPKLDRTGRASNGYYKIEYQPWNQF